MNDEKGECCIISYTCALKPSIVKVLRLNMPHFFAYDEQADFEKHLDNHGNTYYLMKKGSQVIGGCGYKIDESKKVGQLSWSFIDPGFHGKNYGSKLVGCCLNLLSDYKNLESIEVRTSQHAYRFFLKFHFRLIVIRQNFWAQSLDLYLMERKVFRS